MTDQTIPGPPLASPPVSRWWGCFSEMRRDNLGFLLRCQAYGDVVKLPMGLVFKLLLRQRDAAIYLLNHPADVKHVLVTNQVNYQKALGHPVESRLFGQGVLHAEGAMHHRQRRLFLPFFHGNHVTAYTDLITSKAHDLVRHWRDGTTVDIEHEMAHLTLSIIWRMLFEQDVGPEADTVREAIAVSQRLIKRQDDSLLAGLTPLWVPTKLHRTFNRGLCAMEAMIRRMVKERRTASDRHDDVLALLLAARDGEGRPLSEKEIRDQLVTLLLAGHETTSNALTWTWCLLSQCRSVRERVTQEVNEVLGDRLPTSGDVPRLRYTKMVWEESLRLYILLPGASMDASPMRRTGFHQVPYFHPAHGSSSVPGVCIAMRAGFLIPIGSTLSDFPMKRNRPIHRSAISPSAPADADASERLLRSWKGC